MAAPILQKLVETDTVEKLRQKTNEVIDNFSNYDNGTKIDFTSTTDIPATTVSGAIHRVAVNANTKINGVDSTLNTKIDNVETNSLSSAIALAIALG